MPKVLLHPKPALRRVVNVSSIYLVEAMGDDTRVYRRASGHVRSERDVRTLAEVARALRPHGFVRIHDRYAIDPERVQQIRKRRRGEDWELKLAPPINRVLPISRTNLPALWRAY
jgi:DNA-binding LytR/AlgR family response regulator